jgi:pilus assembly protein CpaE
LKKLLSFDPELQVVGMAGSGEEAIEMAPDAQPHVVLMDINLPGIDGIAATAKLLEVVPQAQVVMLSVQGETDYMRRAMMAGARDFLTKPPTADELLDTIHRIAKLALRSGTGPLPSAPKQKTMEVEVEERLGKVVTVFSAKGGTGCTTVAVNTAIALQNHLGEGAKVALMDASLQFGDVAVFMKLQPARTIADLAPRAHEMDQELLNAVLVPHPSGLKVLAAPQQPEDAELLRSDGGVDEAGGNRRIKAILQYARRQFDYVVVDTHHVVDDISLALLDLSDMVIVLTRPIIPEIRAARMFIELLQKMDYPVERLALVINWVDNKRMGIQPKAIERAMMPAFAEIPLDERTALRAANYGVPFIVKAPRAQISQAIEALAESVVEKLAVEVEEVA